MLNIDKLSIFSLHNRYFPALLLVAFFAMFSYVNLVQTMKSIENDANIINISGRQRMLSQSLILLGLTHLNTPSVQNMNEFKKNLSLMKNSHLYLLKSGQNSDIKHIYEKNALPLKVEIFLQDVEFFMEHPSQKLITKLSKDAQNLLPLLSVVVEEYERVNYKKVMQLEQKQLFMVLLIVLILFIEIVFVLYPASKKIQNNALELERLNSFLEERIRDEVIKNREKDKQLAQQSRLAQMGEMISMIAHQWRQPLGVIGIVNSAIEIEIMLHKSTKESTLNHTAKIAEIIEHLSQTIEDFRDFFKPTKERSFITCNEVVSGVLAIIGELLKTNNILFVSEIECKNTINTYANELKQVILNLMKNSHDALLENSVKNPQIKIVVKNDGDLSIIEVSDNGGGVDEKIIDKIFDPYFTTKNKKNGTGLGLYMSKTIIENHCNGTLHVCNSGDGALFKITIPNH